MYTFETSYDLKAMTALARGLRKTVRHKKSLRTHIFGWVVVVLALMLSMPLGKESYSIGIREIITWLAVIAIVVVLLWEDVINGYIALRRIMPGLEKSTVTFHETGYRSVTAVGESDFRYDTIQLIAEDKDYFVFIFGPSHAQVYDKRSLSGGSVEAFGMFLSEKTGRSRIQI